MISGITTFMSIKRPSIYYQKLIKIKSNKNKQFCKDSLAEL